MHTTAAPRPGPYSARREHLDEARHCVALARAARLMGRRARAAFHLHNAEHHRWAAFMLTALARGKAVAA